MKRAFLILVILAGVLAIGVVGILALVGVTRLAMKDRVPSVTVLELNLETPFNEDVPDDPLATAMFQGTPRVRDVVEALHRAGDDDRVAGLIANVGAGGQGMAVMQEVRDAVQAFRDKGKFAVAFSETFGEFGPGNGGYYVATSFDEIWMQPSGDLNLTGMSAEPMFVRNMLGKIGLEPRMDHRYEFKNAKNMFTETGMTDAQREATEAILYDLFDQVVADIAVARDMEQQRVRDLFDGGPLLGKAALDAGLVDRMGYRDEVYGEVKNRAGDGAELLFLGTYLERAGRPHDGDDVIALVYGVGPVQRGKSGYNAVFGTTSMGSDTVGAAFRAAIESDDVKGIIFRVDSPGGSAVASDVIWRETIRARDAGKPVVVSMGNVAASGGYWVSMDAAQIVAQPGTITSSIGVLGGKMLSNEFWEWMGVDWGGVHTSAQSTLYNAYYDYSDPEWGSFQAWLDRIYSDFTNKVAAGRDMDIEAVREIAKGRVWTGRQAMERGLVDALGGFPEALRLVKEEAGIAPDESITLRKYPREKTTWEKLTADDPTNSEQLVSAAMVRLLQQIQPVASGLRQVMVPPAANGPVYEPTRVEMD